MMNISFIGYGNMAKAIATSLAHNPLYQMRAASPTLSVGVDDLSVQTHNSNAAIIADADVIILAVKPFKMSEALADIKDLIPPQALIISVAAGLSLSSLAQYFPKNQAIVRCMPNIAISVQKGACPLFANHFVSEAQKQVVADIFEQSGIIAWLQAEEQMDMFTALSGSGPAYVFLFLDALKKAGENLGLDKELAKKFSMQTLIGALELAKVSGLDYKELQRQVTSPKGTTAAALEVFKARGFEGIVDEAVRAAWVRALELGKV